jgi:hypothetical protein
MNFNLINDSPHLVIFNCNQIDSFEKVENVEESNVSFKGFIEIFVRKIYFISFVLKNGFLFISFLFTSIHFYLRQRVFM